MKEAQKIFLTKKLYLIYLILTISLLIAIGGFFYFSYETKIIRNDTLNDLKTIATLKVSQIDNWYNERITDTKVFSQIPFFNEGIESWVKTSTSSSSKSNLLRRLSLIRSAKNDYENIIITDAKAKLLIQLNNEFLGLDSTTVLYIKKAVSSKKIICTDLYSCSIHNKIHIDFIAPIISKNNTVIAVLIFRVNPETYFYPLIKEWPTESKTSETFIVREESGSALYLNELNHQKNTALRFSIPLTRKDVPAVQAVLGNKGLYEGVSYHGTNVLAFIIPIKETSWIMIAQVDTKEIFSVLYYEEMSIITFTILLIIVLGTGLTWSYHYRQVSIYKELFIKEKELREFHEEFRTILYSIGDGVITTDVNSRVKQMNLTAEILTGWTEIEAIGKSIDFVFNVINEESKDTIENPVHRVLKEGVIVGLANHTLLISRDGKEIPIADSGAPIRDEKGKIEGVVLVFHDTTEQRKAELIISNSEARLNRAELASKSGNWELHLDTKTIHTSLGACKLYGIMNSPFNYDTVRNIPLPEYRPKLDRALKNLIEFSEPYDIEFKIQTSDTRKIKFIHSIAEYDKEKKIIFGVIHDITEQKISQEALLHSNQIIQNIIDNSPSLIYLLDSEGKFLLINRKLENVFQNSKEKVIGTTRHHFMPKDIADQHRDNDLLVIKSKMTLTIEEENIEPDGTHFYLTQKFPLQDLDGNVYAVGGISTDITARKNIENLLEISVKKWQTTFDGIKDSIFLLDSNGIILQSNKASEDIFGVREDEILGNKCHNVIHCCDYHIDGCPFVKMKLSKKRETMLLPMTDRWLEVTVDPLLDENENIVGAVHIVCDITGRKISEESLIESEERYRTFINSTSDMVFLKDEEFKHIIVNEQLTLFYGKTPDEMISLTDFDLLPESAAWQCRQSDEKAITSNSIFVTEEKIGNNYYETTKFPIALRNNKIGVGGIIHDITERKNIEAELNAYQKHLEELVETRTAELDQLNVNLMEQLQKEKELELILRESLGKEKELNELKTKFISITSHEFRTPLTSILSSAELLQRYMSKWDEAKKNEHLERVIHSVGYLKKMLDDILTISRSESGTISYNPENIDFKEFVFDFIDEIKIHSKKHQINIYYNSIETKYLLDRKLIRFTLSNLLSNATKYSPDGGKVDLTISTENEYLKIEVSDEGIGIPLEETEKIFQSFYRSKNAENISGTGLGLAIVKSAVDLHSGKIEVKSVVGKGTSFFVRLPIKKPNQPQVD